MKEKRISLDEEAYELLNAYRHGEESFSDAVIRLTEERSWREVAGIWEGDVAELERVIDERRD